MKQTTETNIAALNPLFIIANLENSNYSCSNNNHEYIARVVASFLLMIRFRNDSFLVKMLTFYNMLNVPYHEIDF